MSSKTTWATIVATLFASVSLAGEHIQSCTRLEPRESALVSGYVGTPLRAFYLLRRLEDQRLPEPYPGLDPLDGSRLWILKDLPVASYEVLINIKFNSPSGGSTAKFEAKVRGCYAKAREHLRGPSGEYLSVRLAKDDTTQKLAEEVAVSVENVSRGNAAQWRPNFDCATILHETMHLLGLVDEYRESQIGLRMGLSGTLKMVQWHAQIPSYDCRALGPSDSLMALQSEAYDAVSDRDPVLHLFKKTPERPSLLFPAQFRAIVEPACEDRNPTYYACSREAYRSSHPMLGSGCGERVPDDCKDPKKWLTLPL